ncbi:hypothetical protein COD11_02195 [Bacillus sp. AFS040349]|nr:hypothetical protein COD11_02195 [Bacillus sp. AFS040349]
MKMPLYSALQKHAERNSVSLHVPGHKNGTVMLKQMEHVYKDILRYDVTELTGLDDLHDAKGVIAEAQQLTAELYGVERSYFLVNGSTVGNLAMIMGSCLEGEEVLVQRNSHKSIIHGIQLAGATPIFLSPKVDEDYQVPSYVECDRVKKAISLYPNAKALIITNPNYYGLTVHLKEVIEFAHKHHIPVLVDEAHGAHFIAGNGFPASAIEAGADVVIHSAHKTLPAMTMGSYLHFNSKLIDREKVEFYLSVLQSSSPSYPIMASLDMARAYLESIIKAETQADIIKSTEVIKQQIKALNYLDVIETNDKLIHSDPLKVTIRSTNGLSGYELQDFLELHGLYAELANPNHVLFILPFASECSLGEKLGSIKPPPNPNTSKSNMNEKTWRELDEIGIHRLERSYSYFKKCEKQTVSLEEAVGHFSAESIIPYPPGIPFIMIGQTITADLVDRLKELLQSGVNIQGDNNIKQGKISIYKR